MRKLRADSGSPNPHRPLGQKPLPPEPEKDEESEESESESDSDASVDETSKPEIIAEKQSSWKVGKISVIDNINCLDYQKVIFVKVYRKRLS